MKFNHEVHVVVCSPQKAGMHRCIKCNHHNFTLKINCVKTFYWSLGSPYKTDFIYWSTQSKPIWDWKVNPCCMPSQVTNKLFCQCAMEVRRHTPWPRVRCHGYGFTHSQFHSRRYSLRITLKYTTLVHMRCGFAWTAFHDNGAKWRSGSNSALSIMHKLCTILQLYLN